MRTLKICSILCLFATASLAQNRSMQTLFSKPNESASSVTGYGAAVAKMTQFANQSTLMTGGYGGVLLNHRFTIGAGGYGLTANTYIPNEVVDGKRVLWEMNYAGLVVGYTSSPRQVVHLTGNVLTGAGYVRKQLDSDTFFKRDPSTGFDKDRSYFYAVEPSLGIEVNAFNWMRIEAGGSYRFIFDSKTSGITDKGMSAPAGHLTLKFGKF